MNQISTPKSCVQRQGRDYVEIPRSITTGLRQIERYFQMSTDIFATNPNGNQIFVPYWNLFKIDQGSGAEQRIANSIFIHRIEFDFHIFPIQSTLNIDPEPDTLDSTRQIVDPRVRVMVVQPKRMMRYLPVDATNNYGGTKPYWDTTGSAALTAYPEKFVPPIQFSGAFSDQKGGMIGSPDPKQFDVEYDDVKNMFESTQFPFVSFSQIIQIRKRFDYPTQTISSATDLQFTDSEIFNAIPQTWIFIPPQKVTGNVVQYNVEMYCKMIYD